MAEIRENVMIAVYVRLVGKLEVFGMLEPAVECTVTTCARQVIQWHTERSICYRKSVLHLLKHMFHVYLSRCSTDLR